YDMGASPSPTSEGEARVEVGLDPRRCSVHGLAKAAVGIRHRGGRGDRPPVRQRDVEDEIDFVRERAIHARGGEPEGLSAAIEEKLVVDQVDRQVLSRLQLQTQLVGVQVAVGEDVLSQKLALEPRAPLRKTREEG